MANSDVGMRDVAMPQQSFRDTLVETKALNLEILEDLLAKKLVTIDFIDGNPAIPRIFAADNVMEKLCKGWEITIIVKLLDKNVGYKFLLNKLHTLWKPNGTLNMVDLGQGFFQINLVMSMT